MPQSHFLSATINIITPESAISYNMCTRDLPDIYALALRGRAYISGKYPSCPCYNLYIYTIPTDCCSGLTMEHREGLVC